MKSECYRRITRRIIVARVMFHEAYSKIWRLIRVQFVVFHFKVSIRDRLCRLNVTNKRHAAKDCNQWYFGLRLRQDLRMFWNGRSYLLFLVWSVTNIRREQIIAPQFSVLIDLDYAGQVWQISAVIVVPNKLKDWGYCGCRERSIIVRWYGNAGK